MAGIRSRGNKGTEGALAAWFRTAGITGWRRHREIRGGRKAASASQGGPTKAKRSWRVRPDFVFARERVAVFVHGCFWHGCPQHGTRPKDNRAFWRKKITGNQARDKRVTRHLRAAGWRVLHLWEHDLRQGGQKRNPRAAAIVRRVLGRVERLRKKPWPVTRHCLSGPVM